MYINICYSLNFTKILENSKESYSWWDPSGILQSLQPRLGGHFLRLLNCSFSFTGTQVINTIIVCSYMMILIPQLPNFHALRPSQPTLAYTNSGLPYC